MATSAKKPAVTAKPLAKKAASIVPGKTSAKNVASKTAAKSVAKPTVKKAAAKPVAKVASKKRDVNLPVVTPEPTVAPRKSVAPKTVVEKPSAKKATPEPQISAASIPSTAATPGFKSALNPSGAWPFPTGARPK